VGLELTTLSPTVQVALVATHGVATPTTLVLVVIEASPALNEQHMSIWKVVDGDHLGGNKLALAELRSSTMPKVQQ